MWFIRRILRVPWTARRTNEEVLQMAGVKRELMTQIRKRQLGFLGLRGRDVVHQEDVKSSMDGQKDKQAGVANGGSQEGAHDANQEETARFPWPCTKRRRAGERLLVGHGGRKESKGETDNEIYGWNQRTNWMWKD